jgi:copper(I)-binding protein
MKMDGDVMRMRAMPRLPIPAGKPVALRPGGVHVMLTGLKRPLSKGERIPLKLKIETPDKKLATVDVEAEVRELGSGAPPAAPGGHGSH